MSFLFISSVLNGSAWNQCAFVLLNVTEWFIFSSIYISKTKYLENVLQITVLRGEETS